MKNKTAENTEQKFLLTIDHRQVAKAYAAGAYEEVVSMSLKWLMGFAKLKITSNLSKTQQEALDGTAETLIYYLMKADFRYTVPDLLRLMSMHPALSNLFAMSSYGGTDSWLKNMTSRGRSALQMALIWNARNTVSLDRKTLFDINPKLASEWYGQYMVGPRGFASDVVQENLKDHLKFWDDRMELRLSVSNGYMRSTYIDPTLDRVFKSRFNSLVRKEMLSVKIRNRPKGNKIALVTGRWSPVNPTYKNRYPLFQALAEKYDLCLVHVGPKRGDLDAGIFSSVHEVQFKGMKLHSDVLFDNDFDMVFYPDIGMNVESRFLSNFRLAPIQITTNSHPVSTFGSEIDFFVTGVASEQSLELAPTHYSERLVLIPGIGTQPVAPSYIPQHVKKNAEVLCIGCPWGSLKFNHDMMATLQKIQSEVGRKVVFRFLSTLGVDYGSYVPFLRDLQNILGVDAVELFASLPYPQYMDKLAECDFALDPFPFGGNTSIIDCLALRLPIVTRRGWQFYNLAGPVMQSKFGLAELSASSEYDYIRIASKLALDVSYRNQVVTSLDEVEFGKRLNELSSTQKFVEAMTYLMDKKPDAKLREPLLFV